MRALDQKLDRGREGEFPIETVTGHMQNPSPSPPRCCSPPYEWDDVLQRFTSLSLVLTHGFGPSWTIEGDSPDPPVVSRGRTLLSIDYSVRVDPLPDGGVRCSLTLRLISFRPLDILWSDSSLSVSRRDVSSCQV